MDAQDLKTKTPDELQKLLMDQKKTQMNMRFSRANGALEKTHDIRRARRTIARIKTFMNMNEDDKKAIKTKTVKAKAPKKAAPKKEAASKTAAKKTTTKKKVA